VPVDRSKAQAERLKIDISSIKAVSYGQNKFWLAVLDDCTDHVWSFFIKKKNDTVDKVLILIKAKHDLTVKYVRCDNAGKNIKLEEACKKDGLGIQFEYTSPGTPQRNGLVKRKFATLYGRVRAMMNHAVLPDKM
jgi:transposase InsO family protein